MELLALISQRRVEVSPLPRRIMLVGTPVHLSPASWEGQPSLIQQVGMVSTLCERVQRRSYDVVPRRELKWLH